ncbi:alcohol dehydrogenase catalytic domain-containing protein [Legionella qingyii]|uniref:alcohol dehydrogenase catalytic domain-containing protein n=1 Tax=Legionella qingyii TaxID=2184757 RepID=UPI0018F5360F|nr:alcohol dehydrogenase catalytic domain-containing protein [Legionella qingyii]
MGVVSQVGPSVSKFKVGDHVGVGCFVDSCRRCESCHEGLEQFCEEGMTLTYNNYEPNSNNLAQGGYSTKIVVDENYVLRIKETQEMLDFCGKHNIVSDIELIPIQQVNDAYERVLKSDVRYRFVIDIASLS